MAGIHPVREALRAGGAVERVAVAKGAGGKRLQEIVDLCRQQSVPVRFEERRVLEKLAGLTTHQGVVAVLGARAYSDPGQAIENAAMVVVLDGIEDPHNLGALPPPVDAAGAHAGVLPARRAAGLTATVAKVSAGALAHVPVVRVTNLGRSLDEMKQKGFWIYGLDGRGDHSYDTVEYSKPAALIVGREGKGLHEHIRKRCDFLVKIPLAGHVASLNVSVACGIALFDWKRRRSGE